MPEGTYTTVINAPQEAIWDFVKDMNNWAPFTTGYQEHEAIDERDSIWTLQGDVGVLTRRVKFRVHITEWAGPSRVAFKMTGISEQLSGEGLFTMNSAGDPSPPAAPRRSWWRRFLDQVSAFLFRLINPKASKPRAATPQAGSKETCRLSFALKLNAGGMIGPVLDAMIEPMLLPAIADLANKIAERIEERRATG